jgi:hypothetical protein
MRDAADRREQKRIKHERMMAKHAERRAAREAAISLYETAFEAWQKADCTGPAPCDPRYYDMSLFPENAPVAA